MTDVISHATIASDEDAQYGYMLADEHCPTTVDERRALFCKLATREWDTHYDQGRIAGGDEARPFTDDAEGCHATGADERPDSHWYVFTDLPDAEMTACGYCGQFGTHDTYCERRADEPASGGKEQR